MTTTHEHDAHCDTVAIEDYCEPDYHEQIAVIQEFEEHTKHRAAIEALESLKKRLIVLENVTAEEYAKGQESTDYAALLAYRNAISTLDSELDFYTLREAFDAEAKGGAA